MAIALHRRALLAQILDMRSEGVPTHLLDSALQEAEAAESARLEAAAAQYEYEQYEHAQYDQGYGAPYTYEGQYGAQYVQGGYDATAQCDGAGYEPTSHGTSMPGSSDAVATGDEILQPNEVFHFGNGELKVAPRDGEAAKKREGAGGRGSPVRSLDAKSFFTSMGEAIMERTGLCAAPRKQNAAQASDSREGLAGKSSTSARENEYPKSLDAVAKKPSRDSFPRSLDGVPTSKRSSRDSFPRSLDGVPLQ